MAKAELAQQAFPFIPAAAEVASCKHCPDSHSLAGSLAAPQACKAIRRQQSEALEPGLPRRWQESNDFQGLH